MTDRDPQEEARDRQHDRAEHVEDILDAVDDDIEQHSYPTTSEELAEQYRGSEYDLVNETESLGSALDRLVDEYDEFETPDEAREALTDELRRDEAYGEAFTDEPTEEG